MQNPSIFPSLSPWTRIVAVMTKSWFLEICRLLMTAKSSFTIASMWSYYYFSLCFWCKLKNSYNSVSPIRWYNDVLKIQKFSSVIFNISTEMTQLLIWRAGTNFSNWNVLPLPSTEWKERSLVLIEERWWKPNSPIVEPGTMTESEPFHKAF